MGSLKSRLEHLEALTEQGRGDLVGREVLHRMTDEELEAYEAAVRRHETGEALAEEDLPILRRADVLREEVSRELAQKG